MSVQYQHLIGLPYIEAEQDCYSIVRRFYQDNFKIKLSDYARPEGWMLKGIPLYSDNFEKEGFRLVDVKPLDWQVGDAFAISFAVPIIHHVAIYVGENKILHHITGRVSECIPYRFFWRKHTVCVWRHKNLVGGSVIDPADYLGRWHF